MDSRVGGLLLLGVGLLCLASVGGVSGELQFEPSDGTGIQYSDGAGIADTATVNESDEPDSSDGENARPEQNGAVVGPFDEPGVYQVDTSDMSVISVEVIGPGGGGGGYDTSDAGNATPGGDGGYIHAKFDVSEFDQIKITVGSGGGGGDSDSAGTGGGGFYTGGDGAQVVGVGGYHVASGGGGGATVIEGVSDGTTEPLAAAGGGGGGASWDATSPGGIKNTAGGGGGAAGGVGGTAEGTFGGGGSDGSNAENSSGPVPNGIGGDGGSAGPSSAEPGVGGGTWVNDQYVTDIEEEIPGGGGSGGSPGGTSGANGADGSVTLNPQIVIESLEFPETVTPEENLTVGYTLTNTGNAEGTESFVDLKVNGTNSTFDDTDTDVSVGPGELVNGTLTFDSVSEFFSPGDSINFTVALWDYDDTASGETAVESGSAPELVVDSLDYPSVVEPTDNLAVSYTVANVGDEAGTESAVELSVGGTVEDSDTDVTLGAGETANGTLTFTDVEGDYGSGDTISFTVGLADFGDSATGETAVEDIGEGPALVLADIDTPASVPVGGELDVAYAIENVGDEQGTESAVELLVDGTAEDSDTDVTVGPGETTTGVLTYDLGSSLTPGGAVSFTVSLSEFGDDQSGQTDVLEDGEVNLAIEPSGVVVEPGATQTYEVIVEGADTGILGYQGVTVDISDPAVGNITGFTEPFDGGNGSVFSNSEIRNGGETLYLEATTGSAFADPGASLTLATFEVKTLGEAGETADLVFDGTAPQTVADFENEQAYGVDQYKQSSLILDAGQGPNLVLTDVQAPTEIQPDQNLTVDYTVENFGDQEGTESSLTLTVDGTEAANTGLTLGSGAVASGTFTFEGVDNYEPGDTLDWTLSLSDFGDTENGSTSIAGGGAPEFAVSIAGTNDPVEAGSDLAVTADVENIGDAEGTQSVALSVAGLGTDSVELTLGPGDSAQETLTVGTAEGDNGQYTAEVTTANDSDTTTVDVSEKGGGVGGDEEFVVDTVETNAPLVEGKTLEVTVSVENVGDAEGTQTLTAEVPDLGSVSTTVTLSDGESTEETLTIGTDIGDAGEHTLTVETENQSMQEPVTLHLPALSDNGPPQDPSDDGYYEDLNADGSFDVLDVQMFFENMYTDPVQDHAWAYDFDNNGNIDIFDVQAMFNRLSN